MNARVANGLFLPQTDVVAADVVALLAGVSFSTTVKVMMALRTVHAAKGIAYDQLLTLEALPTEPVANNNERRLEATTAFVYDVIDNPASDPVRTELKLNRRFD